MSYHPIVRMENINFLGGIWTAGTWADDLVLSATSYLLKQGDTWASGTAQINPAIGLYRPTFAVVPQAFYYFRQPALIANSWETKALTTDSSVSQYPFLRVFEFRVRPGESGLNQMSFGMTLGEQNHDFQRTWRAVFSVSAGPPISQNYRFEYCNLAAGLPDVITQTQQIDLAAVLSSPYEFSLRIFEFPGCFFFEIEDVSVFSIYQDILDFNMVTFLETYDTGLCNSHNTPTPYIRFLSSASLSAQAITGCATGYIKPLAVSVNMLQYAKPYGVDGYIASQSFSMSNSETQAQVTHTETSASINGDTYLVDRVLLTVHAGSPPILFYKQGLWEHYGVTSKIVYSGTQDELLGSEPCVVFYPPMANATLTIIYKKKKVKK